jgi:hypothetical protein
MTRILDAFGRLVKVMPLCITDDQDLAALTTSLVQVVTEHCS